MRTIKETTERKIYNSLIRWYDHANADQIKSGLNWYADAQAYAGSLSKRFGIDPYTAAAVISALSPNNKWDRNKVDAYSVCDAWANGRGSDSVSCCTYNANKEKAFDILNGNIELSSRSPKTHSFAMNVGMLSPKHVTVDKWHVRACITRPDENIVETRDNITAAQYRRIEAITNMVSEEVGLMAYEFQAIVWVTIKDAWNR